MSLQISYNKIVYQFQMDLKPFSQGYSKSGDLAKFVVAGANIYPNPSRYAFNLDKKITFFTQARSMEGAAKADSKKHLIYACIQTALLVALIVATLFAAFSTASFWIPLGLGSAALFLSYVLYLTTSVELMSSSQAGGSHLLNFFYPNEKTRGGRIVLFTVVWPLIGGLLGPLLEALTKHSRWEGAKAAKEAELAQVIKPACEFYKTNATSLHKDIIDDKLKRYLSAELEFLGHFDNQICHLYQKN